MSSHSSRSAGSSSSRKASATGSSNAFVFDTSKHRTFRGRLGEDAAERLLLMQLTDDDPEPGATSREIPLRFGQRTVDITSDKKGSQQQVTRMARVHIPVSMMAKRAIGIPQAVHVTRSSGNPWR